MTLGRTNLLGLGFLIWNMRELPEVTSRVFISFNILGLGELVVGVVFEYRGDNPEGPVGPEEKPPCL